MIVQEPRFVQRCTLNDEAGRRLEYDYMGSARFEIGEQPRSLKRIFAKGIDLYSSEVEISGEQVKVFLVAGKGFPLQKYQPHLQILATEVRHNSEPTYFKQAIEARLGVVTDKMFTAFCAKIDCWFDFENDVLWVLSEDKLTLLLAALEEIKAKWDANAKRRRLRR